MNSRLPIALSILLAAGGTLCAAAPTPEQLDFFEKQVRPLLSDRCYECHSAEKKTKGGLALDTRESTLKGGDTGPALVTGDPEKSLLIEAVRYANHDLQMPPKRRLADGEVKVLEEWVKMGAPDPRAAPAAKQGRVIDIAEGRKFWSFTPLARVEPPKIADAPTPIDAFLRAKLSEKGLQPAPPTDKRTLLRRATFDLIGLPPTPEEMDAFLADTAPDAFDKVIERLLASPHYGERWGRHWLDVARYADSNGMDENIAFGNAWRYRDYVVRAFNQDKPYDQFLTEQIAGDLLPSSEETIAATGFLSLGARVLAEPDMQKLEMDIIDEQMDTLGKAFLGMTFGCARCHDHKFDPVTQEDYYSMAAIFRSTRSLAAEKMGAIKFCYEHSIATPEQISEKKKFDEEVKAKKAAIAAISSKARTEIRTGLQKRAAEYLAAAVLLPEKPKLADATTVAKDAKLEAAILLTCRQYLDLHPDAPVFAEWREFTAKKDAESVRAHYEPLFTEAITAKKGPAYDALADAKGFLALPVKDADVLAAATLAQIAAMTTEVTEFEAKGPELPAIMSVTDNTVVPTLAVHLRGSYLTLGKPVERGFPEVMRTSFTKPILPAKHSGRLELARWMASSEHPLTARVLVNRVWRWHFGQGIVTSTDNFGVLGAKPSHPELLDWLARTFIESGWSIKDLHRLIMKSAAYQQASHVSFSAADKVDPRIVDPENRLLWHANIQRLEAEEIRDAMLITSGWLDLTIGGKTIPLHDREFVFNHTSKDATTYESPRRALYLPIIRNHIYDMLEQFDYPDPTMPTGSRNATVIAPQALIMMNAPVVLQSSTQLAASLAKLADDEQRLQHVYALLYGRAPLDHEKSDALAFVRDLSATEPPERAWAILCQSLFAANEFIYLR
ncbi:MAG TPA: PSD1 and planctomycete cytochrome C domain-containing protein [Chthoniobacter sp.]|nr:PSD1 and planctomycete cytochrome C domain-containing protein [Chthoniobacter sp.]